MFVLGRPYSHQSQQWGSVQVAITFAPLRLNARTVRLCAHTDCKRSVRQPAALPLGLVRRSGGAPPTAPRGWPAVPWSRRWRGSACMSGPAPCMPSQILCCL